MSEDLISREWVLNKIYDLVNDINGLPSESADRPQGEWRHYEGMLTCSNCKAEFYDDIMEYCGDDVPKFCPNCGCDMRMKGADDE